MESSNNNKLRILLFNTDAYQTLHLRAMLKRKLDIEYIDTVSTFAEGIQTTSQKNYDMLIIDYDFPNNAGLSMFFRLRESGYTIPTILAVNESDREQSLLEFADGELEYVVKDDQFQDNLVKVVRRMAYTGKPQLHETNDVYQPTTDKRHIRTSTPLNQEITNSLTYIIAATQLLLNGEYQLNQKARGKVKMIEENANIILNNLMMHKQAPHVLSRISQPAQSSEDAAFTQGARIVDGPV
ncbi:MAG: response regulator [candidate division Zixibacteria bacterium]|nr:response regulator [candidate division Zixibacteria bacterium]